MGALLMSVEKVTNLTTRSAIYESLYNSRTTPERVLQPLHAALLELYAIILQLIALSHQLLAKSTVTRALNAIINPGQLSDLLEKCQNLEMRVEVEAHNCERMCIQQIDIKIQNLLESFQVPILRIDQTVSSFLEKVDERERLETLEWISNVRYGVYHATVKEQRTRGTCEWLLEHSQFQEWRDTSSSVILWLHGTRRLLSSYF
jgi:ankyrin repeat domain-containing protein 50